MLLKEQPEKNSWSYHRFVTLCNPRVLGLVWLGCLNNSFQCLCIELKTVGLKKTTRLVMVFFTRVFELRCSF